MEAQEIIKFVYKYWVWALVAALLGGLIGWTVFSKIVNRPLAVGYLYVTRSLDSPDLHFQEDATTYFDYEGYYSQQNASNYTETVLALLESDAIHTQAVQDLGLPLSDAALKQLEKNVKVRKKAPQLIELQVYQPLGTVIDPARIWETYSSAIIQTGDIINKAGDSNLHIIPVEVSPLVKNSPVPAVVPVGAGFMLGFVLLVMALVVRDFILSALKH